MNALHVDAITLEMDGYWIPEYTNVLDKFGYLGLWGYTFWNIYFGRYSISEWRME